MKNRHMHDNGRVLVVGTTPDYVHWIRGNCPDRALFITDPKIRKAATEPSPRREEEILVPLEPTGPAVAALKGHLEAFGLTLTGITCFDCEALAPAARIASAMGLSYHSVESVRHCRDKQASKAIWQDNHIPCPKTAVIATPDHARSFLSACPDGIVLKPFYGSGSELVFLCRTQEDCHAAFEKIRKGLEKRRNNPLFCRPEPGNGLMLAEAYIPGPEFSCDMMVDGNDLTIIRLARKLKTPGQPFGTIAGYLLPGKLPAHINQADLEATLLKAARVLGIDRGICMVDFIAGKRGISLIELTPRPGGDCLPALLRAAGNLDILELALDAAERKPLTLNGSSRMTTHIGWRIHASKAGVLKKIHTGPLAQEPRVKAIHLTRKPGHVIALPPEDYDSWVLGHMIIRPDKESFPETQSLLIGKRLDVEIYG